MVKDKKQLNSKMRDIISALHKNGGALTENQIAKETGLSYITVRKYIKDLLKKGLIVEDKVK